VKELTTPVLSTKWELRNACGAVARAPHCYLSLKTEGCRHRLPPSKPIAVGKAYVLSKKEAVTSGAVVTETLL